MVCALFILAWGLRHMQKDITSYCKNELGRYTRDLKGSWVFPANEQ
jgi:hypothetical protein